MGTVSINATDEYGWALGVVPVRTHDESACADDAACCIHKPSDHPLRDAPLNWRSDRGLMERVCIHGVGHPDPDDIAHKERTISDAWAYAVHGCDGCCRC